MEETEGFRVPNLSNEQLEKLEECVLVEVEKRGIASSCLSCPACGSTELAWTKFDIPHRSERDGGEHIRVAKPSSHSLFYEMHQVQCVV